MSPFNQQQQGISTPPPNVQGSPPNQYIISPTGFCLMYADNVTTSLLDGVSPGGQAVGYIVFSLSLVFIWTSLAVYYAKRKHSYLIKRAPFALLFLSSLGGSILALAPLETAIPHTALPCWINLLFLLIIPLWIGPLTARTVAAANRAIFLEQAGNATLLEMDEAMENLKVRSPVQNVITVATIFWRRTKISSLEWSMIKGAILGNLLADIVVIPFLLLTIGEAASNEIYLLNCYGCYVNLYEDIFIISTAILIVVFLGVLFRFRLAVDPFGELQEIKINLVIVVIFAGLGQGLAATLDQFSYGHSEGWDFEYLTLLGYLLMHFNQVVIPVLRTQRHLNADAGEFDLVLHDDALKSEFVEFSKKEMSFENIRFLDEVSKFRADHPHDDASVRLIKATRLCTSMIVEGSPLQLNIPADQRIAVEESVLKKDVKDVDVHVFDAAYDEIKKLIERDSFPRFKRYLTRQNKNIVQWRSSKLAVHSADEGISETTA